jgi:hypothetical protein
MAQPDRPETPDEPPPFLGTWRRLYTVVALYLVAIILLFYWFTVAYR